MAEELKRVFTKWLFRTLALIAVTNWFVLGIYFYKFGPGNWFELSDDQQVWAHFGDFYSGLMGPFLSVVAFTGILVTILLQMKQLDLARQQAEIQEIQRVLASVSAQIDQLLSVVPTYYRAKGVINEEAAPLTLFNHISAIGTELLRNPSSTFTSTLRNVMQDIAMSVNAVSLELHSLSWALENYQGAGGSSTMVEFYKFRYGALIGWLEAMNAIDKSSRVHKVFDVELLKTEQAKK